MYGQRLRDCDYLSNLFWSALRTNVRRFRERLIFKIELWFLRTYNTPSRVPQSRWPGFWFRCPRRSNSAQYLLLWRWRKVAQCLGKFCCFHQLCTRWWLVVMVMLLWLHNPKSRCPTRVASCFQVLKGRVTEGLKKQVKRQIKQTKTNLVNQFYTEHDCLTAQFKVKLYHSCTVVFRELRSLTLPFLWSQSHILPSLLEEMYGCSNANW